MKFSATNRIDGIIFDLEGVLIEAKEWHREAVHKALESFGYEVRRDLCYEPGLNTYKLLKELSKHGQCPANIKKVWKAKQKETKKIIERECHRNQRIYDVVKFAHEETDGNIAVATNCSERTANLILENLEIDVFFKVVVTSGDVDKPKPHPIAYITAANRLDIHANRCLAIDDSTQGIMSALEARCRLMRVSNFEDLTVDSLKSRLKKLEIRI
jgi:HAD superfamily hydrolase (TIGR01509 family)